MEQKFDFSRRVVDHRIPYDLNYALNRPNFSQGWKEAYKQRWIGNLIKAYGLYFSMGAVVVGLFGTYLDAIYRDSTKPLTHQSAAFTGGKTAGRSVIFLAHHKNQLNDLGNWNHNFACFEKEPNCGRDFKWVKKENN